MKFLYIGDPHERPTPPVNRLDNWEETYNAKVNEIISLGLKHNVKAILHGGDFFSSPKYSSDFVIKVLNRWGYKNYNESLLREGAIISSSNALPLVGPIGNHDLFGASMKSYDKTTYHFLEQIGFLTVPTKENPLIFKEDDFTLAISTGNYELDMDETKKPYIVTDKKGDFQIHVVHGMLSNKKWMEGVPHTTIDEILETKADLTIAGHDHKGFGLVEHNGKQFVNPGAPFRSSIDEIKRKPKVLLIEVTKEGISVKTIYLKTAKAGEEVLDPSGKDKKMEKQNILAEVKAKMKDESHGLSTINEIIQSIASDSQIDEEITKSAINRVTEKIEASKTQSIEDETQILAKPYYIKKMILENFGSHEYSVFDFSDGLNVFVGATSSGKTTCFRALKWLYNNDGNSRRLIKKGKDFAKVTIFTSHGYIISRFVETKKSGKNGYEITYPDGTLETTNTKGLKVVQDILSYKKLDLENKKIDLNFLEQGVSWFFIGDAYTASDRAKIIGSIYQTHFVDLAIKDLEADSRRLTQKKDDKEADLEKLNEEVKSFDYLPDMKSNIDELENLKARLIEISERTKKADEILEKRNIAEKEMQRNQDILDSMPLDRLLKLKEYLLELKTLQSKIDKCEDILEKRNQAQVEINKNTNILKKLPFENITLAKELLKDLKDNQDKVSKGEGIIFKRNECLVEIDKRNKILNSINTENVELAKNLLEQLNLKNEKIQKASSVIEKRKNILKEYNALKNKVNKINFEDLELAKKYLKDVKSKVERVEKALPILDSRKIILNEGKKLANQINYLNKSMEEEMVVYKDLLIKNGKCPICNSEITKIIAEKIVADKVKNK